MAYYGIKRTHELRKERLIDYIKSQYFGENNLLLSASDELLSQEGELYCQPYIESTPSYEKVVNGIQKSSLDEETKAFFQELIDHHLGVYKVPFTHQVSSLENYAKGKNLFVATGTGSGKTECFIWPMIYKLFKEAKQNPESWKKRGVRALIIYPMNALVSDQISRLRSIIGGKEFEDIFSNHTNGRRPQFGRYTGRTPYPGSKENKKSNHEMANAYKETYLINEDSPENEKTEKAKEIEGLKQVHKYPSKDMDSFVKSLERDDETLYSNTHDAELLTRFERQKTVPDILITNYSMLEYRLFRRIEDNIWDQTKDWLNLSDENRILIILDEAHRYSGASGGEVALLIKRLFSRLGVTSNKINFIFTSASMPYETKEDKEAVEKFACDLSGAPSHSFEYLIGNKTELSYCKSIPLNVDELARLNLEREELTDEKIDYDISLFAEKIYHCPIDNGKPRQWLYQHLPDYEPFRKRFKLCQGNAISYESLLEQVIGGRDSKSEKALENLLLIAPLAKDEDGNVLFPARRHAFFRGIDGIYACLNPNCSNKHEGDHLHSGELFTQNKGQCPECGAKIYELLNDRRCGALFIKGYINRTDLNSLSRYYWPNPGIDNHSELIQFPLYICPENYDVKNRPTDTTVYYLDVFAGKLYQQKPETGTFIKVLAGSGLNEEDNITFKSCPKCEKNFRFISLSDFKVKGNLPFYNIVKAQFDAEPYTKKPSKYLPNGGKKVLLFSDSRQSAAVLARDRTKIADRDSFRKAIYLAREDLFNQTSTYEYSRKALYVAFLKVSCENNLHFFYGKDLSTFEEDKNRRQKQIERCKKKEKPLIYSKIIGDYNTPSKMFQSDLIELFCSPTKNFINLGLGYLVPMEDKLDEAVDLIGDSVSITEDEFEKIFCSFLYKSFVDAFAFDNSASEDTRRLVKYKKGDRYGFLRYSSYRSPSVKAKYPKDYEKIYKAIVETFYRKEDDYYFLNLDAVKIRLTPDGSHWTRCLKCGEIQPFNFNGHCAICDSTDIEDVDCCKLSQIDYWRKPIFSQDRIKSIDTEEHSAQLNHKDQTVSTWAKTEEYEMRFQDINVEKEGNFPIDILSCTTTMEVGIDIESLIAIGLRNVPPLRSNYQQRAGRAGRRGSSLSTITTYAQNGPHDAYYFSHPDQIIKGKPSQPWIDVHNQKLISRHFNRIVLNRFFHSECISLYDSTIEDFVSLFSKFHKFVDNMSFTDEERQCIFLDANIEECKSYLFKSLTKIRNNIPEEKKQASLFDYLFEKGIMPTYSFPLDVVSFNIEDNDRRLLLSPQRSLDLAIKEYAPGNTIVVDKKTYKSGGIYDHVSEHRFPSNQARSYFENEKEGYYKELYLCGNPLCGWFGTKMPKDGNCPFCGQHLDTNVSHYMLRPWGFAPLNGKEIPETEAISDDSYTEEPCYSATPSDDLIQTKYPNLSFANRSGEERIIINKGDKGNGFDVCKDCGAAHVHNGKSLKENGVGAPFYYNGYHYSCNHKNVAESIYLGSSFLTDRFFMQINLDIQKITRDQGILKSAAITLSEAMHLAASRVLDIEYHDINVGNRLRSSPRKEYLDIFFYDGLSSGAGYSTQIGTHLDEIIHETKLCLCNPDNRDICNFWNQDVQCRFNKKLALSLLNWMMEGQLPNNFTIGETNKLIIPIKSILKNESNGEIEVIQNKFIYDCRSYKVIPGFCKKESNREFSDFEIEHSLPRVIKDILKG